MEGHITEPRFKSEVHEVGDLKLTFRGEDWGDGYVDTQVTNEDKLLCWITWEDRKDFIKDLNAVISKFRI